MTSTAQTKTVGRPSKAQTLERALIELEFLVDHGVEYPEAQFRVTQQFRVGATELQAAYDAHTYPLTA